MKCTFNTWPNNQPKSRWISIRDKCLDHKPKDIGLRERALPYKRHLTLGIPLRFPETQSLMYNEHCVACLSPVYAMIKWREINETILCCNIACQLVYQLKFLVSYGRNIYWASTIYHTFGIPRWIRYVPCLLVEETHTEQLVIQLCYESSGEAIQENPWLPRVTMDSPILGRGRWRNTSWVLKDTLKVARWREWHETGTFLLPKVLWTEKWKPWQLSFMVLRHWVMARSDERRVVKKEAASGRSCLPWCVEVFYLDNRVTLRGFEQEHQSIASRFWLMAIVWRIGWRDACRSSEIRILL